MTSYCSQESGLELGEVYPGLEAVVWPSLGEEEKQLLQEILVPNPALATAANNLLSTKQANILSYIQIHST